MAGPPLFVLTVPEGALSPGFNAGVAAAAQVPGINALTKVTLADAFNGNFAAIDNVLSIFPSTALLHIGIAGMPMTSNAGVTYRTVTLPLYTPAGSGGSDRNDTILPVIWDAGYQADFVQAFANLKAYLVANNLMTRLFALSFCPATRVINDTEYTLPSTNPAPYLDDFSGDWLDVGYSEAACAGALNTIAAGIGQLFPNIFLEFAFNAAGTQKLGFIHDPGQTFASSLLAGMVSAAAAYGGVVTPIQQSFSIGLRSTNFALTQGRTYGRLLIQVIPNYRTPGDINAALAAALRLTPAPAQLQIHYNQAVTASAFMANLSKSPLVTYNGTLVSYAQGPLTYIVP